jgi:hypothetical protein
MPLPWQVQEALLHSQRMFRQRVERRERALLRAALAAWLQRRWATTLFVLVASNGQRCWMIETYGGVAHVELMLLWRQGTAWPQEGAEWAVLNVAASTMGRTRPNKS